MNISKALWLLLLIGFGNVCHGENCISQIPDGAREIVSGFRDWRIVTLTDLPADDQQLWQTSHNGRCPGVASGNFMGGTQPSYVIAMIHNQRSGKLLEQLLILIPEGKSFKRTILVKPTAVVSPFVVWKLSPGKYKGVDQEQSIEIPHDSFVYEKIEAFATQYYYDDGHLHSIVTAN